MGQEWVRPQDKTNKENETPHRKFNAFDRGHEFCFEKNKGDDKKPVRC